MTMFRKVFGNHLTASKQEMQVMDSKPQGDLDPSEIEPLLSKTLKAPVQLNVTRAPTALGTEPSELAQSQRAALLASRAAEAQSRMMEAQVARKATPPSSVTPKESGHLATATIVPASAQAAKPGPRARTRLLGFDTGADDVTDPFAKPASPNQVPSTTFPAGWIVIVKGPGRGASFPIHNGAAMIGRGEDQAIRLDFGDTAISRQNHAAIAYDVENNKFYIGHGGKSNIIRLNDRPLLSTETLSNGDMIRIGETTLRFVALCSEGFEWGEPNDV